MRLNKKIAALGVCSRRDADKLIQDGLVKVNNITVNNFGTQISDSDEIEVNGQKFSNITQQTRVWLYNKPRGLVVSHRDNLNRPTIFDSLPDNLPRVISVGRLDIDSEGLLILTNDSDYARKLELPQNNHVRIYKVRVFGAIKENLLKKITQGVKINGVQYRKCNIEITKIGYPNSWLQISLYEGKNREVRKLMEHVGLQVSRLIRVQYGPYNLGKLTVGNIQEVKPI